MSDNCKSCLMLKNVRKLKVEQICFCDTEEKPAYCRACYQRERIEKERLRESLEDMVCQFAFWSNCGLITGGLSALELAFDVLGWDEPHKVKSMQCDEPGCKEKASCGWKSENGYRNTCFKHKQVLKETK